MNDRNVTHMPMTRIRKGLGAAVIALTVACSASPGTGVGSGATPTASASGSAVASATPSASASPSMAPAAAYLDDRSTPELTIRSYYDAIGRRQFLRAYAYWEPAASLPAFDAFAKAFDST